MAVTQLPLGNGFYESAGLPVSAQECVNFYVNIPQAPALSAETLFGTPGTVELATSGTAQQVNRGAHVMAGIPFFVNGDALYRLSESSGVFSMDPLGTIEAEGRVSLADNGTQLMILVPGGKGYIFTADPDTLTEITDPDFRANGEPQHTVFIDGYFAITTDTKKFIVSSLNDGTSYNALDFGTAEADPDDIVAPVVFNNQLFIMGSETTEAFQNIGGADFPFQRSGLFLTKGLFAPFSVVVASDTFFFIGGGTNESPAIWAFVGNNVQKVSTTAIDSILQGFTEDEIKESFAWSYAQKGAYFVGFSLPTTTLVLDTITQKWHERKSRATDAAGNTNLVKYRANSFVSAYGRVLVGDSRDGRVGSVEPEVFTEYGQLIFRRVASQPFMNNMQAFFLAWIELTVESGVGTTDTPNPQIGMSISLDGGKTFRDQKLRGLGRKGEFNRRAIWRRLGRVPRFAVFRFTLTDPVKPVIIALFADIQGSS